MTLDPTDRSPEPDADPWAHVLQDENGEPLTDDYGEMIEI